MCNHVFLSRTTTSGTHRGVARSGEIQWERRLLGAVSNEEHNGHPPREVKVDMTVKKPDPGVVRRKTNQNPPERRDPDAVLLQTGARNDRDGSLRVVGGAL